MGQLTETWIKTLTEPGRYIDGEGLMMEIAPGGSRSWKLQVRFDGKRRDFGLGSLSIVTLTEARAKARGYRHLIAQGIDPVAEKQKEKIVFPTFRIAAQQVQSISTLETYAYPFIGDRLVNDIERPQIRKALLPIWLSKPETARRVRQRIGAVLDCAYVNGFRDSEAPMRSLSKGLPRQPKDDGHLAAMRYTDIPAFIAKLRQRSSVGRVAMEVLILTAARSGEIRGATWSEFDLDKAMWSIPASRMKMGRPHFVPLASQVLEALRRAKAFSAPCTDLAFPGMKLKTPMSDMTLLKILRDMAAGATVHGFRSTFRDWLRTRPIIRARWRRQRWRTPIRTK